MRLTLDADQLAVAEAFAMFYARESTAARVRAAEPLGYDADLWGALVAVGGPTVALDAGHGGGGGTLLDAALVAEQHGRWLGSAPLVEATVAMRLLAAAAGADGGGAGFAGADGAGAGFAGAAAGAAAGRALAALAALVERDAPVTMALRPAVNGVARLVPWAAVVPSVIVTVDDTLVLVRSSSPVPQPGMGAPALADVVLADADAVVELEVELARGSDAERLTARALDEWRALQAAALVGLAAEALRMAVDHAKERHQFGRPIGSFQALAHGLVDVATAVDGARLLALEAAWALGIGDPGGPALASMAFAFAAHTARTTTTRALHAFGGYGFMEEYDVQLYHRRARSWTLVHQSVPDELRHLARTLWGA